MIQESQIQGILLAFLLTVEPFLIFQSTALASSPKCPALVTTASSIIVFNPGAKRSHCAQNASCSKIPKLDEKYRAWGFKCSGRPSPIKDKLVQAAYDGITFVIDSPSAERIATQFRQILKRKGLQDALEPVADGMDKTPLVRILAKVGQELKEFDQVLSTQSTLEDIRKTCRPLIRDGSSAFRPSTALVIATDSAQSKSIKNPCFNRSWSTGQSQVPIQILLTLKDPEILRMLKSVVRRVRHVEEVYPSSGNSYICREPLSPKNSIIKVDVSSLDYECKITPQSLGLESTHTQALFRYQFDIIWNVETYINRQKLIDSLGGFRGTLSIDHLKQTFRNDEMLKSGE